LAALPSAGAAVYFRRGASNVGFLEPEPGLSQLDQANREETYNRFLLDFENTLSEYYTVINRPEAVRAAAMKLRHLRAARAAGFHVPQTLVTSDPDAVGAFLRQVGGRAVYKPYRHNVWRTGERAYAGARTCAFEAGMLDAFAASPRLPAIFQARIDKRAEHRLAVFGQDVAAVRQVWTSEQIDWRAGARRDADLAPCRPAPELVKAARALMDRLGVDVATLDLAEDQDGALWFLDFNPNGQFLYMEALAPQTALLRRAAAFLARRAGYAPSETALAGVSWAAFEAAIPDHVARECAAGGGFTPRFVRKAVALNA
jgi:glutathione synthase/RimK-type ligase-like ATP-grasp enzyme